MLLYMCPHTTIYVSSFIGRRQVLHASRMCPDTTTHVSWYYYICVLIHTTYYYTCVFIHTTYSYIWVLIHTTYYYIYMSSFILYTSRMCPHTTIHVSSFILHTPIYGSSFMLHTTIYMCPHSYYSGRWQRLHASGIVQRGRVSRRILRRFGAGTCVRLPVCALIYVDVWGHIYGSMSAHTLTYEGTYTVVWARIRWHMRAHIR